MARQRPIPIAPEHASMGHCIPKPAPAHDMATMPDAAGASGD